MNKKSTLLKTVLDLCSVGISDIKSGQPKFYPGHQQLSPIGPDGHPLLSVASVTTSLELTFTITEISHVRYKRHITHGPTLEYIAQGVNFYGFPLCVWVGTGGS